MTRKKRSTPPAEKPAAAPGEEQAPVGAPPPMPAQPQFNEFLDDYFAECDEHLLALRRNLLALESAAPEAVRPILDQLLISFHTIKGLSGMVGFDELQHLAHGLEHIIRRWREGEIQTGTAGVEALGAGVQLLEQALAARHEGQLPVDTGPLVQRLEQLLSGAPPATPSVPTEPPPSEEGTPAPCSEELSALDAAQRARLEEQLAQGARAWHFTFTPSPELAVRGISVNTIRARLQEIGELIHAVPRVTSEGGVCFDFLVTTHANEATFAPWRADGLTYQPCPERVILAAQPPAAPSGEAEPTGAGVVAPPAISAGAPVSSVAPSHFVRVDLARLDDLMRMLGDLVVSRARLEDSLSPLEALLPSAQWRTLQEINLSMERQLRDLREGIMRVRMVPIGETFERMQFVVRDLAREQRKQVRLEVSGQETEIDKLGVERMLDPLLHLVRNAVSHGIELPAERQAAGKPPAGTIALRAATAGEMVIIEIEDDGQGIDVPRVMERARELGLLDAEQVHDDTLLLDVLCSPGFSTRDEADLSSGRGVGMTVVRDTVYALGGTLDVWTERGRGSRFTISLPLTLAIMDALILTLCGQRFAIPQSSVREVIEVQPEQITVLENNEVVPYRESVLPLMRLARVFHMREEANGHAYHALVVGGATSRLGIVVDRVLGQREIVVRSIADPLLRVPGIAGATELGDGRAVLILDAAALVRLKSTASTARPHQRTQEV